MKKMTLLLSPHSRRQQIKNKKIKPLSPFIVLSSSLLLTLLLTLCENALNFFVAMEGGVLDVLCAVLTAVVNTEEECE